MKDLPTPYQQYYVYAYKEGPDIVYIGKGCKGRAWHCGYSRGDTNKVKDTYSPYTEVDRERMLDLRTHGYSYEQIGKHLNVSTMTVHRSLV